MDNQREEIWRLGEKRSRIKQKKVRKKTQRKEFWSKAKREGLEYIERDYVSI